MVFESAIVLAPVIVLMNWLLNKRITAMEMQLHRHTDMYLTRTELVSELNILSRKLDLIEHKVDIGGIYGASVGRRTEEEE